MIRDKWLSIFAGVLAVAAACFLGIALYIFINSGSGSENGAAGNQADVNEIVTTQAATGADVTAAGETNAGRGRRYSDAWDADVAQNSLLYDTNLDIYQICRAPISKTLEWNQTGGRKL